MERDEVIVADLRKKVKEECSHGLEGIDSNKLKVFQTEEQWGSRDQNSNGMSGTTSLVGLGTQFQPLIVTATIVSFYFFNLF